MYKHILIATDGSELAAKAVTQGLELAKALRCEGHRRDRLGTLEFCFGCSCREGTST